MQDLALRDYLRVLSRRKWIVLQAIVIVPLAAVLLSLRQHALYQSSADVLLRYQTLPSALSGISDPNATPFSNNPQQVHDTQIQLARLPVVAKQAADALPKSGVDGSSLLADSSVSSVGDTDLLRFTVTEPSATLAEQLATTYAKAYTSYRKQIDTTAVTTSLRDLARRIDELQTVGTRQALANANTLQGRADQLRTLLALERSNAVLVREASGATKVRPRPTRYGLLGLGLGIVLGIGLAFLRDAFDTRVRSAEEVGELVDLPLLGRLPAPPRHLQVEERPVMLAEPLSHGAEAFRILRSNLELASFSRRAQVIMVTSAVEKEGKSTTAANLAVAFARAGKHTALVDLDLRRPAIRRLFGVDGEQPGVTNVVVGHSRLDEALVDVALNRHDLLSEHVSTVPNGNGNGNGARTNGRIVVEAPLEVLVAGALPPNPGEFVGNEGVRRLLGELRERVDVVVVDAPPLLHVGDALTISTFVDALIFTVRADRATRPVLSEAARALAQSPAEKLGFVLCGAAGIEAYGYYGSSSYKPVAGRRPQGVKG